MAGAGALMALADTRAQDRPLGRRAVTAASVAQVAALAPGVSRAGAVLTALRLSRVSRELAWQHTLQTSLPVTAGAAAFTLARADHLLVRRLLPALAVGAPASAITSAAVVSRVPRVRLHRVALYRLGLAAVIAGQARGRRL